MVEIETHNDNERLFLNLTRNGNSERLVISYHMLFIVKAKKKPGLTLKSNLITLHKKNLKSVIGQIMEEVHELGSTLATKKKSTCLW